MTGDSIESLAAVQTVVALMLDRADAMRAAALERDYSPTVAEQMALEFYRQTWFASQNQGEPQ
jgi:hypothetical protein